MTLNKSILLIFAVISALLLNYGMVQAANNTTQPGTPPAEISGNNIPRPRIVFEKKLLDFGKIGPESKPNGEFKFTNEGNATLVISKISECCGVATSLEGNKTKYEPGEKGVIKVSYTANVIKGVVKREPIVHSNDPVEPNLALMVTAEIVNKVSADPQKLKLFLNEKNAKCPKVKISSNDNQAFSIRGIQSTGGCITAHYDPNVKAKEFTLDLKVDMKKLEKNMMGDLDVIITHPEMSLITIPFDVLSKFTIEPAKIIAFNAEPMKPIVRKIWVFNNYNQDFDIESVSSKNGYFTVLSKSKVPNGYQFDIQLTPPPSEGKMIFSDELYFQVKDGEKLKIDCNGYYTPPQISESNKEKP